MARGSDMFVGFVGAKKLGGTRGRPKKDVDLLDVFISGLWSEERFVEMKDASGVNCSRLVN